MAIVLGAACLFCAREYKLAGLAGMVWMLLSLLAQDITGDLRPFMLNILICALVLWIIRKAFWAAPKRWPIWLHHIVVTSMCAEYVFLIISIDGGKEWLTPFYHNAGAGLYVLFWFVVSINLIGVAWNVLKSKFYHPHNRPGRTKPSRVEN